MVGHHADEKAIHCMDQFNIDMRPHIAKQINASLIKQADLILVMSTNQAQHIEKQWPFAKGKVFRLGHWQKKMSLTLINTIKTFLMSPVKT
jgi:protein-tyrosine phosphatase